MTTATIMAVVVDLNGNVVDEATTGIVVVITGVVENVVGGGIKGSGMRLPRLVLMLRLMDLMTMRGIVVVVVIGTVGDGAVIMVVGDRMGMGGVVIMGGVVVGIRLLGSDEGM